MDLEPIPQQRGIPLLGPEQKLEPVDVSDHTKYDLAILQNLHVSFERTQGGEAQ